jgi:hypothetical protein
MPRTPKPDATRRRRNAESKSKHIPAGESWAKYAKVPALPKRKRAYDPLVSEWWRELWASEMSMLWGPSDVEPLCRLAILKQSVYDAGDQGLFVELLEKGEFDLYGAKKVAIVTTVPMQTLSAIKDLEDRYGLNPLARRRAGVEIDPPGAEAGPSSGGSPSTPAPSDRRARLSVVAS